MSQNKLIPDNVESLDDDPKKNGKDTLDKLNMNDELEETNKFSTGLASNPIPISDSFHSASHNDEDKLQDFIDESDKYSSSFCDSESLASMSHSFCDEVESKKRNKRKKKKKIKDYERKEDKEIFARPNYFVGVQISNPEIHKAVVDIQKILLSANKNISPALIDVATLHITLLVAHIANEEELHVACSALDHCGAQLSDLLSNPPLCIKFHGLSHFSNQTIFAKVVEDENYQRFLSTAEIVRSTFEEMGINLPDKRGFTPHLTIAKLSKVPRGKGKEGIRKIEPYSYASELNKELGEQIVTGIQLLSMNKPKNESRYYPIIREALFDVVPSESLDHTVCCFPRQPVTPKLERRHHTSTKSSEPNSSLHSSNSSEAPRSSIHITNSSEASHSSLPIINSSKAPHSSLHSANSSDADSSQPSTSNSLGQYRPMALTVIGGIGLLSFAFALSRWMKRK